MASLPRFSIITPSFRSSQWLRLCISSVADQEGVELEHVVQDSCSDDGTGEWLPKDPRVKAFIEKDQGMYDAINRGLRRASGDICAYLNCDEQYLPGALAQVGEVFARRPDADLVFGDALVVAGSGGYVCHRQMLPPRLRHTVACQLSVLSCVIFFRRRLVEQMSHFDPSFRTAGDVDFMVRCMQAKVPMVHLPRFTTVFTDTGENLGLTARVAEEMRRIQGRFPAWWTALAWVWATHHRLRRWRAGYYRPSPTRYAIYTLRRPERRTEFVTERPTFLWTNRVRTESPAQRSSPGPA